MSYTLMSFNKDEEFMITGSVMRGYLDMAQAHGWIPKGVILEEQTEEGIMYHEKNRTDEYGAYVSGCVLIEEDDVANIVHALHHVKFKDTNLVNFMSYLSDAGSIVII